MMRGFVGNDHVNAGKNIDNLVSVLLPQKNSPKPSPSPAKPSRSRIAPAGSADAGVSALVSAGRSQA